MSISFNVCGVAEVPRFAQANLTDIVSIGAPRPHPIQSHAHRLSV